MQVIREDLNPCTVKLTVVCAPEEVKEGFDRALKVISKTVKLPGFRPGHVPKHLIEGIIDRNQWYSEAADQIVKVRFKKAVEEEKLSPDMSTRPAVTIEKIDQEKGEFEFIAKVPLPPIVEVGDYKSLPLEQPPMQVTDEELDYQIQELRQRRSSREPITDRGLLEGDVAVLNVKLEGEDGDGKNFMTVIGQTFPQLDDAIKGMHAEEMKNLELTFPENFQDKEWSSKTFKCQVTVNSASAVKLPEIDDDFAAALNTESVADLRGRLETQIRLAKGQMIQELLTEQAMEKLLERSKVEVSDNSWEDIASRRLYETDQEQQSQGKTLEDYAKENGMSIEELQVAWQDKAKMYIKRAFLIRDVFVKENMTLTNEELNTELFAMAQEYEVKPEEMVSILQKNKALEELRFRAISHKVAQFLIEHAEIKEIALTSA